jgi:hypothetical protein
MLRSLKFSHNCIVSASSDPDVDVGQFAECSIEDKKGGHVYNLVYYQGRYRIMDYHEIGRYFDYSNCWYAHATDNIFNDHYGNYNGSNKKVANEILINYPGAGSTDCPGITWNWRTYYKDVCR